MSNTIIKNFINNNDSAEASIKENRISLTTHDAPIVEDNKIEFKFIIESPLIYVKKMFTSKTISNVNYSLHVNIEKIS